MPKYSNKSKAKLKSAHPDLQLLFNEVVQHFDNTIVYGYRSPALQFQLFRQGRKYENGIWVKDPESYTITNCDGYEILSKHNYNPSLAIDATPYPIDNEDLERMYFFAGWILGFAKRLLAEGKIKHLVRWGGDWDRDTEIDDQTFNDLYHFELVKF